MVLGMAKTKLLIYESFKTVLFQMYCICAKKKNLSLDNSLLSKLSGLNPTLSGKTFSSLMQLAEFLPNVFSEKKNSSNGL